jgi:hypothetical protein
MQVTCFDGGSLFKSDLRGPSSSNVFYDQIFILPSKPFDKKNLFIWSILNYVTSDECAPARRHFSCKSKL